MRRNWWSSKKQKSAYLRHTARREVRKTQIEGPWTSQCTPKALCALRATMSPVPELCRSPEGAEGDPRRGPHLSGQTRMLTSSTLGRSTALFSSRWFKTKLSLWGKRQFHFQNSNKMGCVLTTKVTTPSMPRVCC